MVVGIEVTVIAVAYTLSSIFIQRKLVNQQQVYEAQQAIKAKTKELNELSKSGASKEQLFAKQKEVSVLLSQSMKSQLKPMFVILPFFMVLYYIVFPMAFPSDPTVTFLSMSLNYKSYFIMVAFGVGMLLSVFLLLYDSMKRKRMHTVQEEGKPK